MVLFFMFVYLPRTCSTIDTVGLKNTPPLIAVVYVTVEIVDTIVLRF